MQYGCIAERLGHSFSREIHAELGDYSYELTEIAPDELDAFLQRRAFCGINVTIPYKERVIPYLYAIDEQARAIGAVNTVVNRLGRLYGYNTDFYGMRALFSHLGLDPRGKKVAVLGTGGTSKTAKAVLESLGAGEILFVSRRASEQAIDYATLYADHSNVEIFVNTTPCGMYPNPDSAAVDVNAFPRLCGVIDTIYNPLRPRLVLEAQNRGIAAEGGLYMLVAQAVFASEIFCDKTYPHGTIDRVYQTILSRKENIVLVGMPASGKSTVGRILAQRLGRELFDLDAEIVKTTGREISEIFATDGEETFRDWETKLISLGVAQKHGLIVATGGGAILREENVDALRRGGRLYFIDRPLSDLMPTRDRPLASSTEAIRRRYEERYYRYCTVADSRIEVQGDAESVACAILTDFYKRG